MSSKSQFLFLPLLSGLFVVSPFALPGTWRDQIFYFIVSGPSAGKLFMLADTVEQLLPIHAEL